MKAELPVKGRLLHLLITPGKGEGMKLQSITLVPAKGKPSVFDFSKAPSAP